MMGWLLPPHPPPPAVLYVLFPISACYSSLQPLLVCLHVYVCVCVSERCTQKKSFCVCVCVEVGKLFSRFLLSLQSHILSDAVHVCVCVCVCVRVCVQAVRCSCSRGESSVCSLGVGGRCFLNRPPPGHLCPCLCLKVPISFSFNSPSHPLYFVCAFTSVCSVCVRIHTVSLSVPSQIFS